MVKLDSAVFVFWSGLGTKSTYEIIMFWLKLPVLVVKNTAEDDVYSLCFVATNTTVNLLEVLPGTPGFVTLDLSVPATSNTV